MHEDFKLDSRIEADVNAWREWLENSSCISLEPAVQQLKEYFLHSWETLLYGVRGGTTVLGNFLKNWSPEAVQLSSSVSRINHWLKKEFVKDLCWLGVWPCWLVPDWSLPTTKTSLLLFCSYFAQWTFLLSQSFFPGLTFFSLSHRGKKRESGLK